MNDILHLPKTGVHYIDPQNAPQGTMCPPGANNPLLTEDFYDFNTVALLINNTIYCFDLESLYEWFKSEIASGNALTDPFSRQPISDDIRDVVSDRYLAANPENPRLQDFGKTCTHARALATLLSIFCVPPGAWDVWGNVEMLMKWSAPYLTLDLVQTMSSLLSKLPGYNEVLERENDEILYTTLLKNDLPTTEEEIANAIRFGKDLPRYFDRSLDYIEYRHRYFLDVVDGYYDFNMVYNRIMRTNQDLDNLANKIENQVDERYVPEPEPEEDVAEQQEHEQQQEQHDVEPEEDDAEQHTEIIYMPDELAILAIAHSFINVSPDNDNWGQIGTLNTTYTDDMDIMRLKNIWVAMLLNLQHKEEWMSWAAFLRDLIDMIPNESRVYHDITATVRERLSRGNYSLLYSPWQIEVRNNAREQLRANYQSWRDALATLPPEWSA